MNIGELGGWVGAIVGGLGGIAGGAIGTYFSVKNTNGPRERMFMIKAAIVCWMLVFSFLGVLFVLPPGARWIAWLPYAILLPLGIRYANKAQEQIRKDESQTAYGRSAGASGAPGRT